MTALIVLIVVVVVVQIALQILFLERRRRLRIALQELLATQQERDARERAERQVARLERDVQALRRAPPLEQAPHDERSRGPA